jgi:hypothetical protein
VLAQQSYRTALPEFWARAAASGYPDMSLSTAAARALLSGLAADTPQGQALRLRVVTRASTYYGTGAAHPVTGAVFEPGDVLFVEENNAARFEVRMCVCMNSFKFYVVAVSAVVCIAIGTSGSSSDGRL